MIFFAAPKDGAALSGRYSQAEHLPGTMHGANPAKGAFDEFAARCDEAPGKLKKACLALGGIELPMGELSFQVPLFGCPAGHGAVLVVG